MKRGLVALLLTAIAGCGGGEVAPGPLRYTLDDMHLAPVPLAEKQAVIDARQEYDIAQMENAKAMSDMDELNLKLAVARNDLDKAMLDERSAQANKREAQKSADMTKRNNAERGAITAELGRKAADAKIAYVNAQRGYMKQVLRYTLRNMYAKQARFEQAKAKVAQAKNIRPIGFEPANFDQQVKERSEEAQRAKSKADQEMQNAEAKRKEWEKREQEAASARGVATAPTDPAATPVTPPEPTPK